MDTAAKPNVPDPVFELKGSAITLTVLHLYDTDLACLDEQLQAKLGNAPHFFKNAPLLLDLSEVPESAPAPDFSAIIKLLRAYGMIAVGVRGGTADLQAAAINANLGVLASGKAGGGPAAEPQLKVDPPLPHPEPATGAPVPTKFVTQTVRSGQRVVAPDGDLVVLASVSSGAEILAGGNIYVYGALRGRALAGAKGATEARIFCLQFNPDLVAVAGEYLVNEELSPAHIGKTTWISLQDDGLKIEPIGTFSPR